MRSVTRPSLSVGARVAHIGHDTWIGAGAMIKPEVTIGHGAVVAAGALVKGRGALHDRCRHPGEGAALEATG